MVLRKRESRSPPPFTECPFLGHQPGERFFFVCHRSSNPRQLRSPLHGNPHPNTHHRKGANKAKAGKTKGGKAENRRACFWKRVGAADGTPHGEESAWEELHSELDCNHNRQEHYFAHRRDVKWHCRYVCGMWELSFSTFFLIYCKHRKGKNAGGGVFVPYRTPRGWLRCSGGVQKRRRHCNAALCGILRY